VALLQALVNKWLKNFLRYTEQRLRGHIQKLVNALRSCCSVTRDFFAVRKLVPVPVTYFKIGLQFSVEDFQI
jgi:hypothetical protein